ncbi:nucleolar complex protein [Histoplasma capsulatum G186AR]|uniref:Nucleolar complex protein n=2 Tax=Ajellomyces capsulatus TaxID=5037 RepID=C0NEE7_AJECG|nr:nucleolar complex protein [Histoplasma capsulatum G186AR]EEH09618.1 nucleolar complex protein [Histoplasma capsulatum G186AR]KAG5288961.1 nucleolar complex protein [Histoplasma capsulatum]QSS73367.1 nucleolar complex protein [Histoplasma capsulatum G186AR]
MAGSARKATKKFEKKHLRETIERRKEFAKVKQRHRLKEKRRQNKQGDGESDDEETQKNGDGRKSAAAGGGNSFADMNVDDFFAGGFDVPDITPGKRQKSSNKKEVAPKIGKRKRTAEVEKQEGDQESPALSDNKEDDTASEASDAGDIDAHMEQLEALKDKDPEFYKYLKENDAELLEFGDHGDLAEVDALSDREEEEDDALPKKKKKTKASEATEDGDAVNTINLLTIKQWQKSMIEQHSMRATRQVVLAFRSAAYMSEADSKERKYTISDADVYHQVLLTALEYVPKILNHHLPTKESAGGKIRVSMESKKFKTLTPLIKSYASSIHQLLTNLSDTAALKLTLASFEPMLPYLLPFRKLLRVILKTVVGIWSDSASTEATRVTAFLIVRRLMVIGDAGIRSAVLKATYEGVVKGSRNTTSHTLPGVNLIKNSAAEIWGIDQNISYTTGFNFIRQLAMHLRSSITQPSKDSYKTVYNWQYIHSLDFWSRVLSSHCDSVVEATAGKASPLRPLIYPVVQITLGAMRLIPTAQYFPLRFQLTRSLLRISLTTGTYIPLGAALVEVLNSAEMRKPPKSTTLRPLDFATSIRAPKSYLRTRVYQDGVGAEVAELLSEFFILWAKNIAFPELSLPVIVMLKRWLKEMSSRTSGNKNTKVNQMIVLVVQKLEANSRWIEERRSKVTFAPKDRAEVEGFLKDAEWETTPLGAFVKTQRKQKDERVRLLEQSRRDDEKKRAEKGDVKMGDNDGDSDGVYSEEVEEDEEEDGNVDMDGSSGDEE